MWKKIKDCEACGGPVIATSAGFWSCPSCRIRGKCDRHEDGCLIWHGAQRGNYGVTRILWNGAWRVRNVHRVMYALHVGPVPDGVSVLHLEEGHNKLCCEPTHLRLVQQPIVLVSNDASFIQEVPV